MKKVIFLSIFLWAATMSAYCAVDTTFATGKVDTAALAKLRMEGKFDSLSNAPATDSSNVNADSTDAGTDNNDAVTEPAFKTAIASPTKAKVDSAKSLAADTASVGNKKSNVGAVSKEKKDPDQAPGAALAGIVIVLAIIVALIMILKRGGSTLKNPLAGFTREGWEQARARRMIIRADLKLEVAKRARRANGKAWKDSAEFMKVFDWFAEGQWFMKQNWTPFLVLLGIIVIGFGFTRIPKVVERNVIIEKTVPAPAITNTVVSVTYTGKEKVYRPFHWERAPVAKTKAVEHKDSIIWVHVPPYPEHSDPIYFHPGDNYTEIHTDPDRSDTIIVMNADGKEIFRNHPHYNGDQGVNWDNASRSYTSLSGEWEWQEIHLKRS